MAGSGNMGEPGDNPVPLNVTALVDIIFCLCIFFLFTFQFRAVDHHMSCWLPKEGPSALQTRPPLDKLWVHLGLERQEGTGGSSETMRVGAERLASDDQLGSVLRAAELNRIRAGGGELPLVVDAQPGVPWQRVMKVLETARLAGFQSLEFAAAAR